MQLEIRSKTEEPVAEIAGQARRIADEIERLRYLRGTVTLVPVAPRWRVWLQSPTVAAIIAAAIIGIAIVVGAELRR